ncbi:MAG: tRNA (adenosine(37)-N6)-dimethylallyltransferase MiaA [Verrucomicrobiia bacterium]
MPSPPVHVFLFGPTGAGKSALALRLAQRLNLEIVGTDAFHIFRRLDIGTAKPTPSDRARIPHHLIDLIDPCQSFTAGAYLRAAQNVLHDLHTRQQSSIWVGGTGLYLRVLRQGLAPAPPTDPNLRRQLEARPLAELRTEILRADPLWAASADLHNPARIIRALAVFQQTGRPLSAWHADGQQGLLPQAPVLALVPPRDLLRHRIALRFEAMWNAGWPDEVRALLNLPEWETSPSSRALGYRTVAAYLRGKLSQNECRQLIIHQTIAYARRQLTWLRREDNVHFIESDGSDLDEHMLAGWWSPGLGDAVT